MKIVSFVTFRSAVHFHRVLTMFVCIRMFDDFTIHPIHIALAPHFQGAKLKSKHIYVETRTHRHVQARQCTRIRFETTFSHFYINSSGPLNFSAILCCCVFFSSDAHFRLKALEKANIFSFVSFSVLIFGVTKALKTNTKPFAGV